MRMSSSTRSSQPGSARSHLVRTTRPPREPEQPEDLQVLAGLGHDRVVGRDDQHGQVEARRAGQHVADEPLVARHVDHRQAVIADLQRREAQVDRDPALLLGRQAVGVDAGQGPHQRRLAVVDVAGGADHEVANRFVHARPPVPKPAVTLGEIIRIHPLCPDAALGGHQTAGIADVQVGLGKAQWLNVRPWPPRLPCILLPGFLDRLLALLHGTLPSACGRSP